MISVCGVCGKQLNAGASDHACPRWARWFHPRYAALHKRILALEKKMEDEDEQGSAGTEHKSD